MGSRQAWRHLRTASSPAQGGFDAGPQAPSARPTRVPNRPATGGWHRDRCDARRMVVMAGRGSCRADRRVRATDGGVPRARGCDASGVVLHLPGVVDAETVRELDLLGASRRGALSGTRSGGCAKECGLHAGDASRVARDGHAAVRLCPRAYIRPARSHAELLEDVGGGLHVLADGEWRQLPSSVAGRHRRTIRLALSEAVLLP